VTALNDRGRGKRRFHRATGATGGGRDDRGAVPGARVAGGAVHRTGAEALAAALWRPTTDGAGGARPPGAGRQRPSRVATAVGRLGWRVYATNVPAEQLSLVQAVLAYRSPYLVASDMGRLKGHPLSLTPLSLERDDHATGLIRLLSVGLRVLTLLECVVRQRLAAARTVLIGRYTGNPKRRRPAPRPNSAQTR